VSRAGGRGGIQRVEAVVVVLDLGAVGDGEADLAEAADDVLGDLGDGWSLPSGRRRPGRVKSVGSWAGQP